MAFPLDPDKVAEELSKRGKAWAELNAAYQALDDANKEKAIERVISKGRDAVRDRILSQAKEKAMEKAGTK